MTFDVDVCALSQSFYRAYPASVYPELLRKSNRPYTCLLIDTHTSFLTCIPFRTSIKHNEAFLFSGTQRSATSRSGLDYKKVVLVQEVSYIVVDADEYKAVMKNIRRIVQDINEYIDTYVNHVNGDFILHGKEYTRRYKYSTLPYFHAILNLPQEQQI